MFLCGSDINPLLQEEHMPMKNFNTLSYPASHHIRHKSRHGSSNFYGDEGAYETSEDMNATDVKKASILP